MGGYRGGRTKSGTGRARDSADNRALVSLRQRPASPENAYLAMPRSHHARDAAQRREPTYGRAEAEEHTPSFSAHRSISSSSSSASMVAIGGGGQHGPNQNQQTLSPGQVREIGKQKILCHNWGNTGKCKFGKSCRFRHETPPSAPREEPLEAGPAYYPSWGAAGMQGMPVYMVPAFLPQEPMRSQVQARRIQEAASSVDMDFPQPQPRDQTRQIHDVAPSMKISQSPRPSNLSKAEIKKRDNKPAPSPWQHQQKQQRGNNSENGAEKHVGRYDDDDDDDEEQSYQQWRRAVYTTASKSKAKATEDQERGRSSWDEALASLDVGDDTAHRRRASYSSSGGACDTCSLYDYHNEKRVRAREAMRGWRVSSSPDVFEGKIAMAAAEEEGGWKREQRERAARFETNADRAEGGRRTSLPASSPGTTNNNNKKGYHPHQPPHNTTNSRAQNKNSGGKRESKKSQAFMPQTKATARQNQQHHKQRPSDGGQRPRRVLSSPDPFGGNLATVATAAKNGGSRGASKNQARTSKTRAAGQTPQRQSQQRKSQSSGGGGRRQPRGRAAAAATTTTTTTTTKLTATQARRRVSYSPDLFEREIAMAAAAEAEKWKLAQAQAAKVKAEAEATSTTADRAERTNGSPEGSQSAQVSGRAETGGDKVQNLIDI
ncbi:hypothetical protein F5B21DRAFT_67443 [Xylaria acuta]|nr:hypothetical protein F5B21DRAFT_67443 [Xylaria acuta]